jgi:hypothetical protein
MIKSYTQGVRVQGKGRKPKKELAQSILPRNSILPDKHYLFNYRSN